jgi:putative hemolysin
MIWLLFALSAHASDSQQWRFGKEKVEIKNGFGCETHCEARAAAAKKLVPVKIAGTNPVTGYCRAAGGVVRIGVDGDSNENSFCRFPDDSYVSCTTLFKASGK